MNLIFSTMVASYIFAYMRLGQLGNRVSIQQATSFDNFEHASNEVVFQIQSKNFKYNYLKTG